MLLRKISSCRDSFLGFHCTTKATAQDILQDGFRAGSCYILPAANNHYGTACLKVYGPTGIIQRHYDKSYDRSSMLGHEANETFVPSQHVGKLSFEMHSTISGPENRCDDYCWNTFYSD
ncbi:MAG: hypothetical protein ACI9BD_000953 [Candidatus Marinamargulisbacteria bacterium]|jgi:hypothetical protein